MDIEKVVLKFKMNAKGTHHIAYCDEYPQIQGIGPDQGHATANFWKAFNNAETKAEHQSTSSKKAVEKESSEKEQGKKKKSA
jgi:hypothetical protein